MHRDGTGRRDALARGLLNGFDTLDQLGVRRAVLLANRSSRIVEGLLVDLDELDTLFLELGFAAEQGLQTSLLPVLEDIDTLEDWERYCSQIGDMPYISTSEQRK